MWVDLIISSFLMMFTYYYEFDMELRLIKNDLLVYFIHKHIKVIQSRVGVIQ